jgi:enoyl-CoA hydratase
MADARTQTPTAQNPIEAADGLVLLSRHGTLGHVLLNRPKALNAISLEMVQAIEAAMQDWEADPSIRAVMIEGAGEKAFCAGGDVIAVSAAGKEQSDLCRDFFREEYRLNRLIHRYTKPYIAWLDGIVMGGGVGLSVHGHPRIATERSLFAMPETAIGLFPDVGGSHFLPRCPGETGIYLGLTGARLKAGDMLALGLADVFIPSDCRDALHAALAEANPGDADAHAAVRAIVDGFAQTPPEAPILAHREEIDRLFAGDDLDAILDRLRSAGTDFAEAALAMLSDKSPTMLKVSLAQLRRGADQDFDANMVMEYRMVRRALQPDGDFHEGVRAMLIDKDKAPTWSPDRVEDVSEADVASYFEPPPEGDLTFHDGG